MWELAILQDALADTVRKEYSSIPARSQCFSLPTSIPISVPTPLPHCSNPFDDLASHFFLKIFFILSKKHFFEKSLLSVST